MILGRTCTRACAYCNVEHGRPSEIDPDEPTRIAEAVRLLALDYVVITSVDRDDLEDGGANAFARTIIATRALCPTCRIETLVPDFAGKAKSLDAVLAAQPDVLNHNLETVDRQYPLARPGGNYERALQLLDRARHHSPTLATKSGLMVGLGETWDEILETMQDLRDADCELLTIGQYLRPTPKHTPLVKWYTPGEFDELRLEGESMGFSHIASGPLVRSSYHADEQHSAATAHMVSG